MFDYSCISLIGDNELNEDKIEVFDLGNASGYVLADGLGGHGRGEVASAVVADYIKRFLKNAINIDRGIIKQSIIGAHEQLNIIRENSNQPKSMKTTVVVLILTEKTAYCGYVGDSRLYAFNHGRIFYRTKDHSVPQMLVEMGQLSEKEIRTSPDRNRLLRAVGMQDAEIKVDVAIVPKSIKKGVSFLLCSDGFWEYIYEREMEKCCFFSRTSEIWLEKMTKIVQANGKNKKMDNYSAIAIKCRQVGRKQ